MTTSTPASAPPSPSPSAEQTPSDSESQSRRQVVVDVSGGDEPWTVTAARSTSDPPSLRTSKRTATRFTTGGAQQETRKGKKKPTGRATLADSGSPGGKKAAVDLSSVGRKKAAEDAGGDSGSDAEEKPAPPKAKRARRSSTSAASTNAGTRIPSTTTDNDTRGFNLETFMATFEAGQAVSSRPESTTAPASSVTQRDAPAASRPGTTAVLAEAGNDALLAELRALREEVERLRAPQAQRHGRWGSPSIAARESV
ncbi:hypothetical protein PInf_009779 [Phytophthora infestans]|nr:hypothetical protein PInf_009779 [Phytophthora infestans]